MLDAKVLDLIFDGPLSWKSRDIDAKLSELDSMVGQPALIGKSVERRLEASDKICDDSVKGMMHRRREMEP